MRSMVKVSVNSTVMEVPAPKLSFCSLDQYVLAVIPRIVSISVPARVLVAVPSATDAIVPFSGLRYCSTF